MLSLDSFINILDENGKKVAILRVVLHLEDLGPEDEAPEIIEPEEVYEGTWKDGL